MTTNTMQVGMLADGRIDCFPFGSNDEAVARFNKAANPSRHHPWMEELEREREERKSMSLRSRLPESVLDNALSYYKCNLATVNDLTKKKLKKIEYMVQCFYGDFEIHHNHENYVDFIESYITALKDIRMSRLKRKSTHRKRCGECGRLLTSD